MSTAEALITSLKSVTAEELRRELQERRETRDAFLAEADREMEMIERLIDVVEPRPSRNLCRESPSVARREEPPEIMLPASEASTRVVEVTRQEFVQSNPATVLGTLSQAMAKPAKRMPKVPITAQPRLVTEREVSLCLEVSGRSAPGTLAHQLKCTREAVTDILENNPQFATDEQGFWDLRARIEDRKEKALRPIEQVH